MFGFDQAIEKIEALLKSPQSTKEMFESLKYQSTLGVREVVLHRWMKLALQHKCKAGIVWLLNVFGYHTKTPPKQSAKLSERESESIAAWAKNQTFSQYQSAMAAKK